MTKYTNTKYNSLETKHFKNLTNIIINQISQKLWNRTEYRQKLIKKFSKNH